MTIGAFFKLVWSMTFKKREPFSTKSFTFFPINLCLLVITRDSVAELRSIIIKFLLNLNSHEYTTSYRGFNLKLLKGFNLNLVKNKGYSFFMGTLFEIAKQGFAIKEIPIIFKDRGKGVSKIPRVEIFRTLINLLILFFKKKLKK